MTLGALLVKLGPHEVEEQTWKLDGPAILIGREVSGERVIRFPAGMIDVSKQHARIRKGLFGFVVEDLDSANGTFVNGERIRKKALRHQDEIRIGSIRLRVLLEEKTSGAKATLRMTKGPLKGKAWDLAGKLLVGRGVDADIQAPEAEISVSNRHAVFAKRGGKFFVADLGSKNGTRVNGRPVREQVLSDGDEIQTGDLLFKIAVHAKAGSGLFGFLRGA